MRRKNVLVFGLVLILLFCWREFSFFAMSYDFFRNAFYKQAIYEPEEASQLWINVFVHGAVGPGFTFLDFPSVKKDKIEKSLYKKAVSLMRKNRLFYQDQPIASKGLLRLEPSFELVEQNEPCLVAYPVFKAFDELSNFANKSVGKNLYYLFGWSGYLSQSRRRLEAIRFYNQLAEEVATYEKLGFKPKVRILAHSHGGNLALNLAGIYHSLNGGIEADQFYEKFEISLYIRDLFDNVLATSFEKEAAVVKKGQKRFAYYPNIKNLFIDELVLLGTPIQAETSLFVESPFFGVTYNVYSDGDVVQSMDFVSTIKQQSLQRIDSLVESDKELYQMRVMVGQKDHVCKRMPKQESTNSSNTSIWRAAFGLKDFSRKNLDPTHKELWFVIPQGSSPYNFFKPLPVVCFFPLFRSLQEKMKAVKDADLEIIDTEDGFLLRLADKKSSAFKDLLVPRVFIEKLRGQIIPWIKARDNSKLMWGIMDGLIALDRKCNI